MSDTLSPAEAAKSAAAARAAEYVKSGMKIGLGTGSTAAQFIDLLNAATIKLYIGVISRWLL